MTPRRIKLTPAQARSRFEDLLDWVVRTDRAVIIERPGEGDAALIAADELLNLLEHVRVLAPPENARGLIEAEDQVARGEVVAVGPGELEALAGAAGRGEIDAVLG